MKKEIKNIQRIGLERVKTLSVTQGVKSTPSLKAIFLAELLELGYIVDNHKLFNDSMLDNHKEIISTLTSMKGGDVDYVPLFNGFPNNVPEKSEFLTKRFVGFFANVLGIINPNDPGVKTMDNGLLIPEWLFDISEFGGDPILGRQSAELFEHGLELQNAREKDSHTVLTHLKISEDVEYEVKYWFENNMYAKSSIKESIKGDIQFSIGYYGLNFLDAKKVVFKEIKAYIMAELWRTDSPMIDAYINTPTDMLRMFASLTDSDISLAEKIKFPKLKRADRKFILGKLNTMANLAENLNQYKGLWLALGRYIHPGEYQNAYPNAFEAFNVLRNEKIRTFNGAVEKFIGDKDLDKVLKLLKSRPGVFGRKLHELIDIFSNDESVLKEFSDIADDLEFKNLLVLAKYFETINDADNRLVINKKGKVIVFPNSKKGKISEEIITGLLFIIEGTLRKKSMETPLEFEEDAKVWIDPELRNYVVPLSLRKQADGLMNIARGTRIKFDSSKVIRLFTYWKEKEFRTDFDASLIEFSDTFEYKGHVSYTNLSDGGIVHSGDLTSSQYGAAEFIDIDLKKIKKGVRYLAIQTFVYSGERFNQVERSYGGWMIRDKTNSNYKSFDISTVQNKFNVVGDGQYSIPMIVDLKTSEIIYIDLYMRGVDNFNRVEGAINDLTTVTKELINMIDTKPNMLDLIKYRVNGSNVEIVEDKKDATVTFGITECTFEVDRVDEILAKMLL